MMREYSVTTSDTSLMATEHKRRGIVKQSPNVPNPEAVHTEKYIRPYDQCHKR